MIFSDNKQQEAAAGGRDSRTAGPFILGLTGGVGAGKTRVLEILKTDYGFHVIQADQVAKALMQPGMASWKAVAEYLGDSILNQDGSINRPVMAEVIFSDPVKRAGVDAITHPLVWEACLKEAREVKKGFVVIEAAIPSKEFRDNCREMWYVYTSRENRMARLKEGRGYEEEKTLKIMENQVSEDRFRAFCDVVIDNNGSVEETRAQIQKQLERLI
ncbi:MAG: dephospho-CoA kinase [Clostridium sp.]|nr:dephospho-CoA kinase [Clostridium sp.]